MTSEPAPLKAAAFVFEDLPVNVQMGAYSIVGAYAARPEKDKPAAMARIMKVLVEDCVETINELRAENSFLIAEVARLKSAQDDGTPGS